MEPGVLSDIENLICSKIYVYVRQYPKNSVAYPCEVVVDVNLQFGTSNVRIQCPETFYSDTTDLEQ